MLPSPPVLKTTIIQLNKDLDPDDNNNNYEILTNDYNTNNDYDKGTSTPTSPNLDSISSNSTNNKKKRRRSTANIDSEELAKRKSETKQLHSIIEKRRRIKINREFEALKYLIPACRNCSSAPTPNSNTQASKKNQNTNNNNGNKIDGMYKLTILKSSVEYILYLHHIIQNQHNLLMNSGTTIEDYKQFNIDFAKIPLNVNQYRNIDKEFNFKSLMQDFEGIENLSKNNIDRIDEEAEEANQGDNEEDDEIDAIEDEEEDEDSSRSSSQPPQSNNIPKQSSISTSSLPTPDFTPDMAPILSLLNKYSSTSQHKSPRKGSFPISPHTQVLKSTNSSPYTIAIKSTTSSPSMKSYANSNQKFSLPDPAINPTSQLNQIPRKKFKQTKMALGEESVDKLSDQDASKTLLALRKSSIDSLLN